MPEDETDPQRRRLGRIVSVVIVVAAFLTGALVIIRTNNHPRTDDAEVFANFIGIAPQVDGPITQLAVQDNQFRKQGELLFEIDQATYREAVDNASAKKRFAASETDLRDAKRSEHARHAEVVSEWQFGIERAFIASAAVDALIVAAVRDGDPEVVNTASVAVV